MRIEYIYKALILGVIMEETLKLESAITIRDAPRDMGPTYDFWTKSKKMRFYGNFYAATQEFMVWSACDYTIPLTDTTVTYYSKTWVISKTDSKNELEDAVLFIKKWIDYTPSENQKITYSLHSKDGDGNDILPGAKYIKKASDETWMKYLYDELKEWWTDRGSD